MAIFAGKYLEKYKNYRNRGRAVFIVYTMGKVGSKTIVTTLRSCITNARVFHTHFLSDQRIELQKGIPARREQVENTLKIRRYISEHPDKRLKIITLVRDPVMREISNIFQNPEMFLGERSIDTVPLEELLGILEGSSSNYSQKWFLDEFNNFLGANILEEPFDQVEGYSIYRWKMADILILKLEKLDSCYPQAFEEFAGIKLKSLVVVNESAGKAAKDRYAMLKEKFRLPVANLDKICQSVFMQHFYTPGEIEEFRQRWMVKD